MITIGIVLVLVASGYWYFNRLISETNTNNKPEDVIEIHEGSSSADIAKSLHDLGAVKSAWAFWLYGKLSKKQIIAGVYTLNYQLSIKELAAKLSSGEYLMTKITIPEGKRLEQIAAMLEDKHIFGYRDVIAAATGHEGRLFPDTYYISKKTTASEFIKMMLDNFDKKTASLNLTADQLVLASIVERESVKDDERPMVAGIYQNRLKIDMRLEADPTVLYAHDSEFMVDITPEEATRYTFWQPIDFSTYKTIISPYNTYINKGLPSGPICSPGLASIRAAISPQDNDYFFFLHDANGLIHPARTLEEHQANIEKYL